MVEAQTVFGSLKDYTKGTIELVYVGADYSIGKIVKTFNPIEPMKAGDIVYSPFVAASVWHDFAGNNTATYTTCPGCAGPAAGSGRTHRSRQTLRSAAGFGSGHRDGQCRAQAVHAMERGTNCSGA